MFLDELSRDEAIAFMHLTSEFVKTDKEVNIEEKKLIDKFFKEMHIENELDVLTLEQALDVFKTSTQRIKNIVYFELIRVGLVDDDYRLDEVKFLDKISEDLGINRAKKIRYANYFYKFAEDEFLDHEDAVKEANLILEI